MWIHVEKAKQVPRQAKPRGRGIIIYALCHPIDRGIRYVGRTGTGLPERLHRHLETPTNRRMETWFAELRAVHLKPMIVALEFVGYDEWEDAERGWIRWVAEQGGELMNVDPGGTFRKKNGAKLGVALGKYQPPVARARDRALEELMAVPKVNAGPRRAPAAFSPAPPKKEPSRAMREKAERRARRDAELAEIKAKSGPVRRLSRDEIEALYGAKKP